MPVVLTRISSATFLQKLNRFGSMCLNSSPLLQIYSINIPSREVGVLVRVHEHRRYQ